MNERIKELALQAMTYVTHNPKANKLNSGDMFDENRVDCRGMYGSCQSKLYEHTRR